MLKLRFVFSLSLLVAIGACKNSTDTTGGGGTGPNTTSNALTPPGVNSVLVYHAYETDSLGARIASTDTVFDTVNVLATSIKQFGKTNVVQLMSRAKFAFYTKLLSNFWNYDSSGDISYYIDGAGAAGVKSGWFSVPLTSKGQTSKVIVDTMENTTRRLRTATYLYSGAPTLVLAGQSFQTLMFDYSEVTQLGTTTYTPDNDTRNFDSKTGILLRLEQPGKHGTQGFDNGFRYELLSATFK